MRGAAVALMLALALVPAAQAEEPGSIHVVGDAQLLALAASEGWLGAGTTLDPIRLAGLTLGPATSGPAVALWIENVTLAVEIVDFASELGGDEWAAGIVLFNVTQVTLVDANVDGGGFGIYADDVARLRIQGGTLRGMQHQAISTWGGPVHPDVAVEIQGVAIHDARAGVATAQHGTGIVSALGLRIERAEVGIFIVSLGDVAHIVEGNEIVGSSLWGISASKGPLRIHGNHVDGGDIGIALSGDLDGASIAENVIENAVEGMLLSNAEDATLTSNTLRGNGEGVVIAQASGITLTRNRFEANALGLSVENAGAILVYDNVFRGALSTHARQLRSDVTWNVAARGGPNVLGGSIVAGNVWEGWGFDLDANGLSDVPRPIATLAFDHAPLAAS